MRIRRTVFKLLLCSLILSLFVSPSFYLVQSANSSADAFVQNAAPTDEAQEEAEEPLKDHQAIEIPIKHYEVFAPHWTTERGFDTTIYIRNVHVTREVIAQVSLWLGERVIPLQPIHIDPLQTVAINTAKALAEAAENPQQIGGASIAFEAESAGSINAYAQVIDTSRSLSFSFPFTQSEMNRSSSMDATAWFYSQQTEAFFTLLNTSEKEVSVLPTMYISGRTINLDKVLVNSRETVTIKLPPLTIASDQSARSAGIHLQSEAAPNAIVAQGWVSDEWRGFSAPFTFHQESQCGCADDVQHRYGTGIMIGASGMMTARRGFASGTIFSPYLAVMNKGGRPLKIKPVFSYDNQGKVERVTLPVVELRAKESAVVNLRDYQESGLIPSTVQMGDIDLQYEGEAGALIAELNSVDQNGTFVSPVPLICKGGRDITMSYWRTDGDWHSSVTLENIAPDANDVEVTISYTGGFYILEKQIAVGETAMISINELQQSQEPDREGRRIPKEATMGGLNIWSRNLNAGLVINAMLMNPITKTCGSCNGLGYVTQNEISDKPAYTGSPLYYGFDAHVIGLNFSVYENVHYSSGSQSGDSPSSGSSSNNSVANMSGGYTFVVGLGTCTLTVISGSNYFTDPACSYPGYLPTRSATLTVVPQVTVTEVGFRNDHQITRWPNDTDVIDNPDGTTPTWKSTNNPNDPVAYIKGIKPTMFATFAVSPSAGSTYTTSIRVKNGTTTIANLSNITYSGASFVVSPINVTKVLESTVKKSTPTFTWEISYDNGTSWLALGNSGPHTMYWTYGTPLSPPFTDFYGTTYPPLYDLALQKACESANGTSTLGATITNINQGIANDDHILYNPGFSIGNAHPLEAYSSAQGCLCADLSNLLRGLLRSIGIDGTTIYIWGGTDNTTQTRYRMANGINVATFKITRDPKGLAPVNPHFTYHAVVSTNSTWYDPSYGLSYSSLSFDETAYLSTPQQTSSTFPSYYVLVGWTCVHTQ